MQRLFAIADVFEARLSADGSAEREQWCVDKWDAVAAEIAAAHNVSLGVASHRLMIARALRERLPRVAEVVAAGQNSYRLVNAIVYRTALITDADARAKVDTELAAAVGDPHALRRVELSSRGRHVDVVADQKGSGLSWIDGQLFGPDAAALDQRLDVMARAVRPIRARCSSAALMRLRRWPMVVIGWPARAG